MQVNLEIFYAFKADQGQGRSDSWYFALNRQDSSVSLK